jgi:hypothetical protein
VTTEETPIARGAHLLASGGELLGTVDAVFADYLLVRTPGILPVDLYVPVTEVSRAVDGPPAVGITSDEAYARWHRPLRSAPHG